MFGTNVIHGEKQYSPWVFELEFTVDFEQFHRLYFSITTTTTLI